MPALRFRSCLLCFVLMGSVLAAPLQAADTRALEARTQSSLAAICNEAVSPTLDPLACAVAGLGGSLTDDERARAARAISPRALSVTTRDAFPTRLDVVRRAPLHLRPARAPYAGTTETTRQAFHLFLDGTATHVHARANQEDIAFRTRGGGLLLGVDYSGGGATARRTTPLPFWQASAALGWSERNDELRDGNARAGEADTRGALARLSTRYQSAILAAELVGFYEHRWIELERRIRVRDPDTDERARGRSQGFRTGAAVELATTRRLGSLLASPLAGLRFERSHYDAYRERGAATAGLRVRSYHTDSLISQLGTEFALPLWFPLGVFTPEFRVSWEHQFLADAKTLRARLLSHEGSADAGLTLRTATPDRNYARLGAGMMAEIGDGLSAFADYEALVGLARTRVHRVRAGAALRF